jgi:putative ABC transport system permease protein
MNFIALKMLVGDRARYAAIIMGITCAALLVTQQLAIFLGYMTRTWAFIDDSAPPDGGATAADIWVMNPQMEFTEDAKRMQETDLNRVRSVPGVRWAVPMFKSQLDVRLAGGHETACSLVGIDDATLVGGPPQITKGTIEDLREADGVIVDQLQAATTLARTEADGSLIPLAVGDRIEINDHSAKIVGLCKLRRNFFWQPMIYTTYTRAVMFAPQQRRMLTYILAKASPGNSPEAVARMIASATGLAAYTNSGFAKLTAIYVIKKTGIAVNFGIAVLLGLIIGTAVAGQSFHNFTQENLRLFGMLKAMGASGPVLLRMVLLQALTAGLVGYGLGVGAAALFGRLFGNTQLAFYFPWQLLLATAAAVGIACLIPALLSVRKVIRLEPGIVFKQ